MILNTYKPDSVSIKAKHSVAYVEAVLIGDNEFQCLNCKIKFKLKYSQQRNRSPPFPPLLPHYLPDSLINDATSFLNALADDEFMYIMWPAG